MTARHIFTALHLYCGLGGGGIGCARSSARLGRHRARLWAVLRACYRGMTGLGPRGSFTIA